MGRRGSGGYRRGRRDPQHRSRQERLGVKVLRDAHEADDVREYVEREETNTAQGLGSMADKLRGALGPREK